MLTDSQVRAIEKRVRETPLGQPLPDFGGAPVLALIDDLRHLHAELRDEGPGTPVARLTYLLDELEKRFPGVVNPVLSDPPEPKLLAALDAQVEEFRALIRELIFKPPNRSKSEVPGLEARLRKALGEKPL